MNYHYRLKNLINKLNFYIKVWPEGKVLFPDFFNNKTVDWWADEIKTYYDTVLKFDGLWIGKHIFCVYLKNLIKMNKKIRYERAS